jgi:cob(I)alamin adenosyltransferase
MIQVYTGDGKGKTTAALGLIIRMLGYGKKVCLLQFMKKNVEYGEIRFLSECEGIDIFQYGTDKLIEPGKPKEIDLEEASKAIDHTREIIASNKYDLIVLDEINVAVAWGLLKLEEQLELFEIESRSEIIMTGRGAYPELVERADLVSEMKEIKHYYQKGIIARKGIEY